MEIVGKSLSCLESALHTAPSQKRMASELGISEGELSKQLATLKKTVPLIHYLGLELSDQQINAALRKLLKEAL